MKGISMKSLMCAALFLFLTGAMVFATGNRQSTTSTGTPTLQIGMQQQLEVSDYADNYMTRYIENLNNVKLNFYMLPNSGDDLRTRIALLASSNDMPETIWNSTYSGLPRGQVLEYGTNGFFIPLNSYFSDASKTPYFNRLPRDDRQKMLRDTRSADGNNYGFPGFTDGPWNDTPYRLWINRAWLSKLGLQAPTTTDELRNVLIAFRDRDPNGNGRRDEMGIFVNFNGGYGENGIRALINSFIYYNGTLALDSTGNNVIVPVTDSNFRKALQYLSGLYREGLIEPSSFTTDRQSYRTVVDVTPNVIGFTSMGNLFWTNTRTNPNFLEMAPMLPPLTGPDGVCYTPYNENYATTNSFITNKARNVDLAVKVMDSFYGEDLSLISFLGEENVDWTRDPARLAGVSNIFVSEGLYPAVTTGIYGYMSGRVTNSWWGNVANPRYQPVSVVNTRSDLTVRFDPNAITAYDYTDISNLRDYNPRRPRYLLPELAYSVADTSTVAEIQTNIDSYVQMSIAEFVTGARDINNDTAWNAYLRELDNMGLQRWVRAAQETYNRQR